MLELQRLTRRYGDLVALDGLSFTVAEGQLFEFVRTQRRRQDHRHAHHPRRAGPRRRRGPMAQTPMRDGMSKCAGHTPQEDMVYAIGSFRIRQYFLGLDSAAVPFFPRPTPRG